MRKNILTLLAILLVSPCLCLAGDEANDENESGDAWQQASQFEAGGDLTCQMAVVDEVEKCLNDESLKATLAEKAASFLNDESTALGRQFYCVQLRVIGTEEQVPALEKYLNEPVEGYVARAALTKIAGPQALAALQKAFADADEEHAVGLMDSLAQLNDTTALPKIAEWAKSDNENVANMAVWTLSKFGTAGLEYLEELDRPFSCPIADAAKLQIAKACIESGESDKAAAIYTALNVPEAPLAARNAAAVGLFSLAQGDDARELAEKWLFSDDDVLARVACAHLDVFSQDELEAFHEKESEMNPVAQTAFFVSLMALNGDKAKQVALEGLESENLSTRINAIHAMAAMADASVLPNLLKRVEVATEATELVALSEAVLALGADQVGSLLLNAMENPKTRDFALNGLAQLKLFSAIDPMIKMASGDDEAATASALAALAKLCDPDDADLGRLLTLYVDKKPGKAREQVERTIVLVCEKNEDAESRADVALRFIENAENADATRLVLLPLLGKLGGSQVHDLIEAGLANQDPTVQGAAVRALCNWPNADYLDDLWTLANSDRDPAFKQMALRAYVRVATLKSDRPESETLDMLQNAMKIATTAPDRNWCLRRAATVRTLDSVNWSASFLTDPALAETACGVLVELAHHRFLRQPNKARFEEILSQVEKTSKDEKTVELAKKARLGM